MARQKKVLEKILKLLDQQPLRKGEIRTLLKINRKTEYENLKLAYERKWVEIDTLGRYNITTLGRRNIEGADLPMESFNFEVYSQVLGFLDIYTEKPKVNCTIEIENANKIKEVDIETKAKLRFETNDGLWLPENDTNLKASVACVADSLLDSVASKYKGLLKILDEQFRKDKSVFDFRQRLPGYDSGKRLMDLAKTNFKVLIEYNGEEWVKNQNFDELEKYLENRLLTYDKYADLRKKSQNINKVIEMISFSDYKTNENLLHNNGLFKSKKDLECFVSNCLKHHGIENKEKIEKIMQEFFNSGLLKIKERTVYCLEMNKEKISKFVSSIDTLINTN